SRRMQFLYVCTFRVDFGIAVHSTVYFSSGCILPGRGTDVLAGDDIAVQWPAEGFTQQCSERFPEFRVLPYLLPEIAGQLHFIFIDAVEQIYGYVVLVLTVHPGKYLPEGDRLFHRLRVVGIAVIVVPVSYGV